ncbi:hypothetical protein Lal_00001343 [Lupinus albus]|nr:hypothetical protein Lal_00001343 [Lupinus albus]
MLRNDRFRCTNNWYESQLRCKVLHEHWLGCKDVTRALVSIDASFDERIKVKVREVNNLPIGLRNIVDFDEQGATHGDAQDLLAGFLGTLTSDCKLFPIDYNKWSGGHCESALIQSYRTSECISRRYCKLSLGRKWSASRQRLWDEFSNPAKTRDEIIRNVSIGIDKDQWTRFVHYRMRPSNVKKQRNSKEVSDSAYRVMGPDHSGTVLTMSMRAVPTNMYRNTRLRVSDLSHSSSFVATSSSSNDWRERCNSLESTFEFYIIMKEGGIPKELTNFFTHGENFEEKRERRDFQEHGALGLILELEKR